MSSKFIDGYLVPILVPSIMLANVLKLQSKGEPIDPLYTTVTLGTVISSFSSSLQLYLKHSIRSKSRLTILTTILLTTVMLLATCGFNMIRFSSHLISYQLPEAARGQPLTRIADMFRYHFFVDLIPGLMILTQSILCMIINFSLLCRAKRRFTIGEAAIVSQLITTAYLTWTLIIYSTLSGAGPFEVDLTTKIMLNIGGCLFFIAFLPTYMMSLGRRQPMLAIFFILSSLIASYLIVQNIIDSSSNPFTWLATYLFDRHQRVTLFSLWVSILTACISLSTSWSRMVGETSSLVRKTFHVAVCAVFMTGYQLDIDFTRFAAAGILCVMFILELCRAWQLNYIGPQLELVCSSLRGKWDNNYLTLSHIYLLVGGFLPLWITPRELFRSNKVTLSSGLISVGVGDTAAAVVGTLLGSRILVKSSGKTLEGLIGNFVAMVLFKLIWVGYGTFLSEISFLASAFLTASIEMATENCDNLVLPLVLMLSIEVF